MPEPLDYEVKAGQRPRGRSRNYPISRAEKIGFLIFFLAIIGTVLGFAFYVLHGLGAMSFMH
jgi:hypothetical protein